MEECNEVTNLNEGSTTGDYFELILHNHDTDHAGSTGRSSPPIPPRKSPKPQSSFCIKTTGKPRALPPPVPSAIENDSILSNCDHSNQTATPPPLPVKTFKKKSSTDKAIQCSLRPDISQDVGMNAPRLISTEDGSKHRVVQADGLLMVSTPANIIVTQNNSVQTIVLAPSESNSTTSNPRMILLHSKPASFSVQAEDLNVVEERSRNHQRTESVVLGTSSRLVLESLAPSITTSQSRGCANEYVGDPVESGKPRFNKYNKKADSVCSSSQGDEPSRKGRGLVCQKCLKCKCNQCRINNGSPKNYGSQKSLQLNLKASLERATKEDARKESTKELLVSLRDDGKIVTRDASEERLNEVGTETGGSSIQTRRGTSAFLLQCFSVICCCSWSLRHACWSRSSDGCQCGEEAVVRDLEDDDVFLAGNS